MKQDRLHKHTDSSLSVNVNLDHQQYGSNLQICLTIYQSLLQSTLKYFVFTRVFHHHFKTFQILILRFKELKKSLMKVLLLILCGLIQNQMYRDSATVREVQDICLVKTL